MFSPVQKLQIVAFLDLLGAGLIVPQLAPRLSALGANVLIIGIMGSIYSAFQLMSNPITGSLIDIHGGLEVMMSTLSLSGLAYALLGVTDSISLFIIFRAWLGITKHTELLTKVLVPNYENDKDLLTKVFGRVRTMKYAGMTLGPIIGGHIMEAFPEHGFTILAFTTGFIFVINLGFIRTLPKPDKEKEEKSSNKIKKDEPIPPTHECIKNTLKSTFNESVDQFYKIDWNQYWDVFSFLLTLGLALGIYFSNYALYITTKFGVNPVTIGYATATYTSVGAIVGVFIDQIYKHYKKDNDFTQRNLHVFSLLIISLIGIAFAPNVPIYFAFIIPLSISSTIGSLITEEVVLCKTEKEQRGTVLGVTSSVRSICGMVCPLIGGTFGHFFGILYVVYVALFFAAYGFYESYVVRRKSLVSKKKN